MLSWVQVIFFFALTYQNQSYQVKNVPSNTNWIKLTNFLSKINIKSQFHTSTFLHNYNGLVNLFLVSDSFFSSSQTTTNFNLSNAPFATNLVEFTNPWDQHTTKPQLHIYNSNNTIKSTKHNIYFFKTANSSHPSISISLKEIYTTIPYQKQIKFK